MPETRKPTKSSQVHDQLLQDIIMGTYAAGEKLPMAVLKQRFGVAYSALREALSSLTTHGLVEREEQCGFRVSSLSLPEFYDLYKLRVQLECFALETALQQGDANWEAELLSSWHVYEKFLQTNGSLCITTWNRHHENFRFNLIKACNSPWLFKIRDMLQNQAARYRVLCYTNSLQAAKIKKILSLNRKLVGAVLKRDKRLSLKLLQDSWNDSINTIAKTLKELLKK